MPGLGSVGPLRRQDFTFLQVPQGKAGEKKAAAMHDDGSEHPDNDSQRTAGFGIRLFQFLDCPVEEGQKPEKRQERRQGIDFMAVQHFPGELLCLFEALGRSRLIGSTGVTGLSNSGSHVFHHHPFVEHAG